MSVDKKSSLRSISCMDRQKRSTEGFTIPHNFSQKNSFNLILSFSKLRYVNGFHVYSYKKKTMAGFKSLFDQVNIYDTIRFTLFVSKGQN